MGEKTKDLAEFNIAGKSVLVELNDPVLKGRPPIVHIQTDTMRFECSYGEFFSFASAILFAEKNLKFIKGLE
jgi:hypothetical protein